MNINPDGQQTKLAGELGIENERGIEIIRSVCVKCIMDAMMGRKTHGENVHVILNDKNMIDVEKTFALVTYGIIYGGIVAGVFDDDFKKIHEKTAHN